MRSVFFILAAVAIIALAFWLLRDSDSTDPTSASTTGQDETIASTATDPAASVTPGTQNPREIAPQNFGTEDKTIEQIELEEKMGLKPTDTDEPLPGVLLVNPDPADLPDITPTSEIKDLPPLPGSIFPQNQPTEPPPGQP